jgi:polar amino acid transport system substrate-binding protein
VRKTALAALASVALLAGCAATGPAAASPRASGQHAAATRVSSAHVTARTGRAGLASTGSAGTAACNPYASLSPEAGGPAATGTSFAATIKKRGYLIAGVDQTTYHFGYLNPLDGQIEGFDIDMIKDVAAAIFGVSPNGPAVLSHIRFEAITDANRIYDIQKKKVDIVAHTMTVNCKRMTEVDFSTIYYDAKARVLVDTPASGPAPTLAQLGARHAKVCATSGSDDLAIISSAHADPVPVTYWSDCLVLLEEGQVAGVVTDNSILYGMQAQDPDTTVSGTSLESEPYGLAISKAHPDFVQFVNAVLARAIADGQWLASCRLWVSSSCQRPDWAIDYVS